MPAGDGFATRFDTGEFDIQIFEERKKDTDRIRTTTHAGGDFVRQATLFLHNLTATLFANHTMKVAHHHWEWMRTERGTDNVMRGADVGDPVTHRFVDCFLERALPRGNAPYFSTTEAHTVNVQRLTTHVLLAHVNHAFEAHLRTHRRSGDTMLTSARLGDDAFLAHSFSEQRLAESVVDLMRSGVKQIFAL